MRLEKRIGHILCNDSYISTVFWIGESKRLSVRANIYLYALSNKKLG